MSVINNNVRDNLGTTITNNNCTIINNYCCCHSARNESVNKCFHNNADDDNPDNNVRNGNSTCDTSQTMFSPSEEIFNTENEKLPDKYKKEISRSRTNILNIDAHDRLGCDGLQPNSNIDYQKMYVDIQVDELEFNRENSARQRKMEHVVNYPEVEKKDFRNFDLTNKNSDELNWQDRNRIDYRQEEHPLSSNQVIDIAGKCQDISFVERKDFIVITQLACVFWYCLLNMNDASDEKVKNRKNRLQIFPNSNINFTVYPVYDFESMRHETCRIRTFNQYRGNGPRQALAHNGFIHKHNLGPTYTTCVFCHMVRECWKHNDDVVEIHRREKPDCPLFTNTRDNIPAQGLANQPCINAEQTTANGGIDRAQIETGFSNEDQLQQLHQQLQQQHQQQRHIQLQQQQIQQQLQQQQQQQNQLQQRQRQLQPQQHLLQQQRQQFQQQQYNLHHQQQNRQQEESAPVADIATRVVSLHGPLFAAVNILRTPIGFVGFYYIAAPDLIRCFFCGQELRNWNNDVVIVELAHQIACPNCSKYQRQAPVLAILNEERVNNDDHGLNGEEHRDVANTSGGLSRVDDENGDRYDEGLNESTEAKMDRDIDGANTSRVSRLSVDDTLCNQGIGVQESTTLTITDITGEPSNDHQPVVQVPQASGGLSRVDDENGDRYDEGLNESTEAKMDRAANTSRVSRPSVDGTLCNQGIGVQESTITDITGEPSNDHQPVVQVPQDTAGEPSNEEQPELFESQASGGLSRVDDENGDRYDEGLNESTEAKMDRDIDGANTSRVSRLSVDDTLCNQGIGVQESTTLTITDITGEPSNDHQPVVQVPQGTAGEPSNEEQPELHESQASRSLSGVDDELVTHHAEGLIRSTKTRNNRGQDAPRSNARPILNDGNGSHSIEHENIRNENTGSENVGTENIDYENAIT